MPINYQNAKIYKLVNDEMPGLVYYGSTCNTFAKRLCSHKAPSNKCRSKCLFEYGTVQIFLVEDYPCENKLQLNARERFYIENNDCVNKSIPGRTQKEYYEANHDEINRKQKEYDDAHRDEKKKYRAQNKEKIKLKHKEYYDANHEEISIKHKEYYDANHAEILIKKKEYRTQNHDEINRKQKEYWDKNRDELNRRRREARAKKKAAKLAVQ